MKRVRYPAEFKAEAVKQVTERGHGVVDVAKRLGMSDKSIYLRAYASARQEAPPSSGNYLGSFGMNQFKGGYSL